jgi:hypothetical protein
MIILKVIFTEDEIRQFFEGNGYKCEMRDFPEWRTTTHNHGEFVYIQRLAVVFPNGKHTMASKLFEQVTESRMKRQIAPINLELQRLIEATYKNNLKTL